MNLEAALRTRACNYCGTIYQYKRKTSKFCCESHKVANKLKKRAADFIGPPRPRGMPRKSDSMLIAKYMLAGRWPTSTTMSRSDKVDELSGRQTFWNVLCGDCKIIHQMRAGDLAKGRRACCGRHNQQQAYINWIIDTDVSQHALALKFGVANIAKRRAKQQNARSIYEIRQYLVYAFPTKKECLAAERECKQTLECGVISKTDMPDGYTETTYTYNLARIKAIYEKHGGKTSG